MSFTKFFKGENGKNRVRETHQTNPSAVQLHPRNHMVYSPSPSMRYQMTESEPLSEYTEIPMTSPRTMLPPHSLMSPQPQTFIRQTMPQSKSQQIISLNPQQIVPQSPAIKMTTQHNFRHLAPQNTPRVNISDTQPQGIVYHDGRISPYHRSPQLLPPPSPQCVVTHFNPEQKFVVHSTSSSQTATFPSPEARTGNYSAARIPSTRIKLSSVNRKRVLYGSIDQVVRWHKMAKETHLYIIYEVVAILDSISRSPSGVYRMILRDEQKNNTLPLQAVFYPIDRELPTVKSGDLITCVGRMVGTNKLQVFDMWSTQVDDLAGLKRISFLCQRTLQEIHLASPEP